MGYPHEHPESQSPARFSGHMASACDTLDRPLLFSLLPSVPSRRCWLLEALQSEQRGHMQLYCPIPECHLAEAVPLESLDQRRLQQHS
jgi:hypothetical protein